MTFKPEYHIIDIMKNKKVNDITIATLTLLTECKTAEEVSDLMDKFAELVFEEGYDTGYEDRKIDMNNGIR